jgi:hypothetical protein
MFKDYKIETG